MNVVLTLLVVNAVVGAWDTIWYHELQARLPQRVPVAGRELRFHAARDGVYVVLYGMLAWWQPAGRWVALVAVLVAAEIVITLCDFVEEDRTRPLLGGIAPGERVLHSAMAIVYGAMLAHLVPTLIDAWAEPTAWVRHDAPLGLSWAATLAAVGIAGSGVRDVLATLGHDPLRRAIDRLAPQRP